MIRYISSSSSSIILGICSIFVVGNVYASLGGQEDKSLLDYAKETFQKWNDLCLKGEELDAIDMIEDPTLKEYCMEYLDLSMDNNNSIKSKDD